MNENIIWGTACRHHLSFKITKGFNFVPSDNLKSIIFKWDMSSPVYFYVSCFCFFHISCCISYPQYKIIKSSKFSKIIRFRSAFLTQILPIFSSKSRITFFSTPVLNTTHPIYRIIHSVKNFSSKECLRKIRELCMYTSDFFVKKGKRCTENIPENQNL